jgi:pteridine reductase
MMTAPGRSATPLAGKVALVTGAGRRIGRAIALALAEDGAHVAVHYNGSETGAAETVALIEQGGGVARAVRADLSDPLAPEPLVRDVVGRFGRLDLLVNSAASMLRTPLEMVTPEQWDNIFALNLKAPFFLALAASRVMRAEGGAIINLSDHMGFESWPAFVPHGIAKAGVSAMTHALAAALAPRVRVNAIAPGAVLAPEGWADADQRRFIDDTPLARLGTPDDVVHAVRYLATATYVTGETLFVDGGRRGAR